MSHIIYHRFIVHELSSTSLTFFSLSIGQTISLHQKETKIYIKSCSPDRSFVLVFLLFIQSSKNIHHMNGYSQKSDWKKSINSIAHIHRILYAAYIYLLYSESVDKNIRTEYRSWPQPPQNYWISVFLLLFLSSGFKLLPQVQYFLLLIDLTIRFSVWIIHLQQQQQQQKIALLIFYHYSNRYILTHYSILNAILLFYFFLSLFVWCVHFFTQFHSILLLYSYFFIRSFVCIIYIYKMSKSALNAIFSFWNILTTDLYAMQTCTEFPSSCKTN